MTAVARRVLGSWMAADLLSVLGSRLAVLAVPWLVLSTTGSATRTGLIAAAELLPMVAARAFSGPVIDRWGAVRSAVVADVVSAVAMICVPLLWTAHLLSFPALALLVALAGAARGPGDSAKQTLLPDLVTATGLPLERVTGIGGTTERLASAVGLAFGGVLVALVGGACALVVTAAGFAVSAALVLGVLRPHVPDARRIAERGHYLTEFRDGCRTVRRDPVLFAVVLMLAATNGLDQAFVVVLLPAWVVEHGLGAQILGGLLAAFMIAAVAGSVTATALSARLPRRLGYVVGFLVTGAPRFLVLAVDAPLPVVFAVMATTGFAAGFINPILGAVTIEHTPLAARGRVLALIGAASLALTPIGAPVGGLLVDGVGIAPTLLITGGLYLVTTLAPAVLPSWRDFGRRPSPIGSPTGVAVPG